MANIITINDSNWQTYASPPTGMGMGLVPRNYSKHPEGKLTYATAFDMPLMTDEQIQAGIKSQEENKSSLQHLREIAANGSPAPSFDQNGQGYCWAYSSTCAAFLARVVAGLPYVRLSAHAIGCLVKGYRNQGGWNGESVKKIVEMGVPSEEVWAPKSMSRGNDTPAMRENAAAHKITEWMELASGGETLKRQLATALLNNCPVAADYNWWGHSVCMVRLVSWTPFKTRLWNSWRDTWSDRGMGDLEGSRTMPNGAIAVRVGTASLT